MNSDLTIIHWPSVDTLTTTDFAVGAVAVVLAVIIITGLITLIRKS